MVIFFKKGNEKDIKNYRPICLLSYIMYKLFTTIITTMLEKKRDENQPREQAGFRSKYSTTDHIHAINQLQEKCRKYNIPLCVAFVDYEKASDSVQTQAILTSLQHQGIEDVYIEIRKDIYTDSSVTVHLHKESEKIRIKRGVRQGDTISPKLLTATLESIFRRLNWENRSDAMVKRITTYYVTQKRLSWYGHVLRRDDTNVAKHVTTMTVGGKRPRGRPKLRWMDRVQSDLRHHQLDPKLAQDREAWSNAVMAIDPGQG